MIIKFKIKEIRENKGISLNQLSKISGVSSTHINDIERGIKEPTLSMLIKIARALEIEDERQLYEVIF